MVKGDEASEDDDAAGEGDDGSKNDPELCKDRSPSSWGIMLATVAGLLLRSKDSAKVFTLLDDGEAAGGPLRHSGPIGGIVTGGMAGTSQLAFTEAG